MEKKFNVNLLSVIESSKKAVEICKQAMIDANDDSCRIMYTAIMKDCEKHLKMLNEEIKLHKARDKWED